MAMCQHEPLISKHKVFVRESSIIAFDCALGRGLGGSSRAKLGRFLEPIEHFERRRTVTFVTKGVEYDKRISFGVLKLASA